MSNGNSSNGSTYVLVHTNFIKQIDSLKTKSENGDMNGDA